MDKQKIYDYVTQKLSEQGCRSLIRGSCAYRGEDGTKCAVGHLIRDEFYDPKFESWGIEGNGITINIRGAIEKSQNIVLSEQDTWFLSVMQRSHDRATNVEEVTAMFQNAADQYGLKPADVSIWKTWS